MQHCKLAGSASAPVGWAQARPPAPAPVQCQGKAQGAVDGFGWTTGASSIHGRVYRRPEPSPDVSQAAPGGFQAPNIGSEMVRRKEEKNGKKS
jgi:hypothetical protein